MPQMRLNAALAHFRQQARHRFRPQAVARLGRRTEKQQMKALTSPLLTQQGINTKQKLKHRPAAHRTRLIGITRKADGNRAGIHRLNPIANFFRRINPLARRDRVLNTRQLFNKTPTRSNQQPVVHHIALIRMHHATIRAHTGHVRLMKTHAMPRKKRLQRHDQILARAQTIRNPNNAR